MLRQIRHLERSDFRVLKQLRLAALQDSPDQFAETASEAAERGDEDWASLTNSAHVAEVDGEPVAMMFAFHDRSDPSVGRVGGMWVAPGHRRAGVGSALLAAARAWAAASGKRSVRLWVVPNSPGAELYRRSLFVATGARKPFPGDESRTVIELALDLTLT